MSWPRAPELEGATLNVGKPCLLWETMTSPDALGGESYMPGGGRLRQHPCTDAGGEGPLGRLRCRRTPCMGISSGSLTLSSWKGNIQKKGGGSGKLGKLLEGQIPSRSLSFIFQHLTSQFQMLSLGSSFAFSSWLGPSTLNESQRGTLTMGRADTAWRRRKWVGKDGLG